MNKITKLFDKIITSNSNNINTYNTLQQNLQTAATAAIDNDAHKTAQDHERKLLKLKETINKLDSMNKFEDYKLKLNSSKFQQLLWLGSAISLVIVAIARIKNI